MGFTRNYRHRPSLIGLVLLLLAIMWLVTLGYFHHRRAQATDYLLTQASTSQALAWAAAQSMHRDSIRTYFEEYVLQPTTLELLRQAQEPALRDSARIQLYRHLYDVYSRLQDRGLRELHFHLPDSRSLLRFHLPDRFDDGLGEVRPAVEQANSSLEPVSGFEVGRTTTGLRTILPVVDASGRHLGSVGFGVSFDALREEMTRLLPKREVQMLLQRSAVEGAVFDDHLTLYAPWPVSERFVVEDPGRVLPESGPPLARFASDVIENLARPRAADDFLQRERAVSHLGAAHFSAVLTPIEDASGREIGKIASYGPEPDLGEIEWTFTLNMAMSTLLLVLLAAAGYVVLRENSIKLLERRRLQTINDTMGEGLYVMDAKGHITHANRRAGELLGYGVRGLLGKFAHPLFHRHADDYVTPDSECPILIATKRGEEYQGRELFERADGSRFIAQLTSRPIILDGRFIGSVTSFADISAEIQVRKALDASEARYRSVVENARDVIFQAGPDGTLSFLNQAWVRVTGFPVTDCIGAPLADFVFPADRPRFETILHDLVNGRSDYGHVEIRYRRSVGNVGWMEFRARRVPAPDGEASGISGTLADISERKQAMDALQEARSQLRATLDAIPDTLCVIDLDGYFIDFHAAGATSCFPSPEQVIGHNLEDVLPRDAAVKSRKAMAEALESGFSGGHRYAIDTAAESRYFELSAALKPPANGGKPSFVFVLRDITERMAAQEEKLRSQALMEAAVANSPSGILIADAPDGTIRLANRAAFGLHAGDERQQFLDDAAWKEHMTGYEVLRADGMRYPSRDMALMRALRSGEQTLGEEIIVRDMAGTERWLSVNAAPIRGPEDEIMAGIVIFHDITRRKRTEQRLELAASVFVHTRDGITITDPDGNIVDVNDAFTRITGYSREEVIGQNPSILSSGRHDAAFYAAMWRSLQDDGYWQGEVSNRRKNGEIYVEMLTITVIWDEEGLPRNYVGLFSDITLQKEDQRKLEHIAHYDALTNLPNRILFSDRLDQAMAQARRHDRKLAVAFVDLDGFKDINDLNGHEIGDGLLTCVAERMQRNLREGDTISRLGGDEFVAVFVDLPDEGVADEMIGRLLAAASRPVFLDNRVLQVSASIGVTFYPQTERVDADQLLRQADQAMYQAKIAGKNRYHVFDIAKDRDIRGRHESLDRIQQALDRNEFQLHYQPQVDLRSGRLRSVEALIRWFHPERGYIPPVVLFADVQGHDLEIKIGEWVLNEALTQVELWRAAGLDIPVSVNISGLHLQHPEFVSQLQEFLAAHPGVRPGRLELEVLEDSALEDIGRVSEVIDACDQIGVGFALDDFGTGYSSLTFLRRLPARALKIDQSFVRDLLDNPDDLAILDGVLGLAKAFGREVVAEGVETPALGELLIQMGCNVAQGYGIARPMPGKDIPRWLDAWHPPPGWVQARRVRREDVPVIHGISQQRAWIRRIEESLNTGGRFPAEPRADGWKLRRWLDNVDHDRRQRRQADFDSLEANYMQFILAIQTLKEANGQGRLEEARKQLPVLHVAIDRMQQGVAALLQTYPN